MMGVMESEAVPDLVRRGWDALAAADWEAARSCFEEAREAHESAEVLDGLSRALHFQGEYESAIDLTERAFVAYREQEMPVEAADRARWLAFLHGTVNSNMAAASGWMARAESLLASEDECAVHGWLVLDRSAFTGDAAERERLAAAALAIARRFGDIDLEYDALALLGESQVASGQVAKGMKLLDEAMTAVSAGEVAGLVAIGDIYCRLLSACESALDITRAEEWMSVAGRFDAWSDFVSPVCRSHYGGILLAVGRWPEAEQELLAAISTFERSYRAMRESPLIKLADLRLRQGRLDEARRLLEGNESHTIARRILATIAVTDGEVALAEELIDLCLDGEDPSDPACAPALELLVQIRVARDDRSGATEVLERLRKLASGSGDERAAAYAEMAAGRVRALEEDDRSSSHLQGAMRDFSALGFPLEAARAQLELARTIAERAPEAAVAEARLALQAFERIGAGGDVDGAAALLRQLGAAGRTWPKQYGTLTKRETEVLSLLAEGCSNAQIAERLYISRRTAEHHVASILSKLDLHSRTEAAAYAVRELPKDQ
jgi:DNA-binding CsgD family transcriptional regulator